MSADIINALFEVVGAFISLLSVRRLYLDKKVLGVSVWPWVFFTSWGAWNLFYYPTLGQTWSGLAAIGMTLVNLWWIILYWRYKNDSDSES